MRSPRCVLFSLCILHLAFCMVAGCAHVPNQWREDGPSAGADLQSPTVADIRTRYEPAELRRRDWEPRTVSAESGAVTHWPLYFEDPFEDKGHGRSDYRLGWEDYVAMPYGYARYTLNWLLFPASVIVTPPWTPMESDGILSRQALGYDHDAAPADQEESAAEGQPGKTPATEEPEELQAPPQESSKIPL
jgi:hypothetical protein